MSFKRVAAVVSLLLIMALFVPVDGLALPPRKTGPLEVLGGDTAIKMYIYPDTVAITKNGADTKIISFNSLDFPSGTIGETGPVSGDTTTFEGLFSGAVDCPSGEFLGSAGCEAASGGGGAGSDTEIRVSDSGSFLGLFKELNFGTDLSVTAAGDTATIDSTASGGGGGGGSDGFLGDIQAARGEVIADNGDTYTDVATAISNSDSWVKIGVGNFSINNVGVDTGGMLIVGSGPGTVLDASTNIGLNIGKNNAVGQIEIANLSITSGGNTVINFSNVNGIVRLHDLWVDGQNSVTCISTSGQDHMIYNNVIENCGGGAVRGSANEVRLINNKILSNPAWAILPDVGWYIADNTIRGNDRGIRNDKSKTKIVDNDFISNNQSDIDASFGGNDLLVVGNYVEKSSDNNAFHFDGNNLSTISGNNIDIDSTGSAAGMRFGSNMGGSMVSGNVIDGGNNAIIIFGSDGAYVGNTATNGATSGLDLRGSDNLILANRFEGSSDDMTIGNSNNIIAFNQSDDPDNTNNLGEVSITDIAGQHSSASFGNSNEGYDLSTVTDSAPAGVTSVSGAVYIRVVDPDGGEHWITAE